MHNKFYKRKGAGFLGNAFDSLKENIYNNLVTKNVRRIIKK
jgi:hypothetical protein